MPKCKAIQQLGGALRPRTAARPAFGMSKRSGSADLPLHGGRVPQWLGERMTRLGAVIAEAIILEYGRDELLRRLAHPFWFQSFGAVMGMDWHSSGITTSVIGALKRGLAPLSQANSASMSAAAAASIRGRRRTSWWRSAIASASTARQWPRRAASSPRSTAPPSRTASIFTCTASSSPMTASWVVVQQGMNGERRQARRYHWLSEGLKSFVEEPHAAIEGWGRATSST